MAAKAPRTLILTPTRELALQIGDSFKTASRPTAGTCRSAAR
ncbi:hypothetical protein [Azospirillum thermophilum]